MLVEARSDISVTGNLQGKSVELSLDENSTKFLMGILTELYPDPEWAVLREYTANAIDSHVEARQTRPIEISLPNDLSPLLIIQDWGVGLSEDEFVNIYSKYGASTKRDTNEQIGMLGLGCKSGLAYTAAFTVVGIKNGFKTTVSVSRNESGGGTLKIIDTVATTEPNGVLVQIPSSKINTFKAQADRLFKYFKPGTALVDGQTPEFIKGLNASQRVLIVDNPQDRWGGTAYDTPDQIVMGGIPYKSDFDFELKSQYHHIVAFVDIGAVDIAPDRESLQLTPKTKSGLEAIKQEAVEGLAKGVKKKVKAVTTKWSAARVLADNQSLLDINSAKVAYKGEEIPLEFDTEFVSVQSNGYRHSEHSKNNFLYLKTYSQALIIHGYKPKKFQGNYKKKTVKWVNEKNLDFVNYIYIDELPAGLTDWVDPENLADWAEIRKIQLDPVHGSNSGGRGNPAIAGYYTCRTHATRTEVVLASTIDTSIPTFYKNGKGSPGTTAIALLNRFYKEWNLIHVEGNRVKKFIRDFPSAKELYVEIPKLKDKFKKSITAKEREYLAIADKAELRTLDPIKVKDPTMRKLIRLALNGDQFKIVKDLTDSLGIEFKYNDYPATTYPLAFLLSSYMLRGKTIDHVTEYINLRYEAKVKK